MKTELKFKVESLRKIPNPYLKKGDSQEVPNMYVVIADVKDIPKDIPMKTNPREQKLTSGVAKKITASLLDESELDFYLLNRGLLLSAKDVTYNNHSNEITIILEDESVHGDVDGGHTYKIIREHRDKLDKGMQYVKIEILTGVEAIFQRLAAARNTSTQVQDKSIAELEHRFEIIKQAIVNEPYENNIFFKENDQGEIDVADILALLNMFNIDRYPGMESFPVVSYSGKKSCIDYYIKQHKEHGDNELNPYVKMQSIIPDIFKLYDTIEINMHEYYRAKTVGGKYGLVKGVSMKKKNKPLKSKFFGRSMEYSTPTGFIYPIIGSFRALLKEVDGKYEWIANPFNVLDEIGEDLVETTVERSRSLGNNPQSAGKDAGNWKTLYMTAKFELMNHIS